MNEILGQKAIIELVDLSVTYDSVQALKGVSLKIPENRVTVIIGPSGCGKSSTLRSINALIKPESGTVLFQGEDVKKLDKPTLRRQMGYAIQNVGLMPHMTVGENISLVPRLLGWNSSQKDQRCKKLLELVKLDYQRYEGKYPAQLSGGESQRVGVARALGANPPVLLMDEPFGAVDPLTREQLQDDFIRIQRELKKTVVFVTHDLEEAIRLADYLVLMKEGVIVQADKPEKVLQKPKDDFVEDFLGTDRVLKRLTLFTADMFMTPANTSDSSKGVIWECDPQGKVVRGETVIQGKKVNRPVNPTSHCVREYSSLKECMARILALGLPAVPVLDKEDRLIGEVGYEQIRHESIH